MAFIIVEPGQRMALEPLAEGQVGIAKSGKCTVRKADLDVAAIDAKAIVMADPDNFRVALRCVRSGEESKAVAVSIVWGGSKSKRRDSGKRTLNLARGIRTLCLEPAAVAGRYELTVKGKDREALLIVHVVRGDGVDKGRGAK